MNIILNTEPLVQPLTGIGYYTLYLLKELEKHNEIETISCFANSRFVDLKSITGQKTIPENQNMIPQNGNKLRMVKTVIRKLPFAYAFREKIRDYQFRRFIKKQKIEKAIYHETNFIAKSFGNKTIATIHDLSHIHFPEYHPAERVKHLNKELPKTIKAADHIIVGTHYIRNEVIKTFNVPPEQITVVPYGVSEQYKVRSENEVEKTLNSYNLKYKSYLLSVATLEPRKNLDGLITAYLKLPDSLKQNFPLIIVGSSGWNNTKLLKKIKSLESKGFVRRLGYIPDDDLPLLYSGAAVFAYISFYEGCGLPLLEAMASGIPVLTSKESAMSEAVENAGILVDPNNVDEIVDGLHQLLSDKEIRNSCRLKGLDRAKQFSWKRSAEETIAVYKRVIV